MQNQIDRKYWDIVKGIGIILVVLGHCCSKISGYIYLFHLPLFFFVSGYLYNEQKYGDDPYLNIANRLKTSWVKYVVIFWILILLHNTFYYNNLLGLGAYEYSGAEIFMEMCKAVLGMGNELMGGTLWFVPVLVVAVGVFGFTITFSRKIWQLTQSLAKKYIVQFVIVFGCGIAGYILQVKQVDAVMHMQVVLLVMPFIWGGYLLRNCRLDLNHILHPIIACVAAIIIYFVSQKYALDLVFQVIYPYMHIVAFLGIYLCLYIAKILRKIQGIDTIFEWYGKASFWIMFIHFPVFRFFDWIYIILKCESDFVLYRMIPIAFPQIWWIYVIIGLSIPLLTYMLYVYTRNKLQERTKEKRV